MVSRMFLPDPYTQAAKNTDSYTTTTHFHCRHTHTHDLPHTYMPTAVRSGRATEPVAMIETCLFKLEPCDMALSAGLHTHTYSNNTQLH